MILTDFYFPDLQSKCNIIIKQKGHEDLNLNWPVIFMTQSDSNALRHYHQPTSEQRGQIEAHYDSDLTKFSNC